MKREREEVKREREDKAEIKKVIKLGLRFISDEKDWSDHSSPKISLRKTKMIVKSVGVDLN